MDHCTVTGYWEEEVDGIDDSSNRRMLWTVIPLSGQVSVQIECLNNQALAEYKRYICNKLCIFSLFVSSQNCTDCVSVWHPWICYWFLPSNISLYP